MAKAQAMTARRLTKTILGLSLLALAACSHDPAGVRIVNGGTSAIPSKVAAPIRALGMGEIGPAVQGKTFQYTRTGASGFVIYNPDGSLTITDDQKGQIRGQWSTASGQYCEAYGPGMPMECGDFKDTGDAYFAAKTHLVEMKT